MVLPLMGWWRQGKCGQEMKPERISDFVGCVCHERGLDLVILLLLIFKPHYFPPRHFSGFFFFK